VGHTKGLCVTGSNVSDDFHTAFAKSPTHPFTPLTETSKRVHNTLATVKSDIIAKAFDENALLKVKELEDIFVKLKIRLQEREELRESMDYYTAKVAKLQKARDQLAAKNQKESPKDEERRIRNEKTLEDTRGNFQEKNAALTAELSQWWERRFDFLGPILADFLAAEKAFATLYAEATQEIDQSVAQAKLPNTDWGALMASCVSPETLAVTSAPTTSTVGSSSINNNNNNNNNYGNVPANAYGNVPANAYGNVPANAYGNVPANAYGNVPANAYGDQKTASSPAQSLSPQRKPPPPTGPPPPTTVRAPPRGPPIPGAGGLTVNDAQNAHAFYQQNQETIHAGAAYAEQHKDDIRAGANYAAAHKDQLAGAAQFLNKNVPR